MDTRKIIIHAKNYKYTDKKMVNGKWRYYYDDDKKTLVDDIVDARKKKDERQRLTDIAFEELNRYMLPHAKGYGRYNGDRAERVVGNYSDSYERHLEQQARDAIAKTQEADREYRLAQARLTWELSGNSGFNKKKLHELPEAVEYGEIITKRMLDRK